MKNSFSTWAVAIAAVLLSAFIQGCGTSNVEPGPPPTLVSLSVTPANSSIAPGTTAQLTATGTYSNHSMQNLTTSVTWTSSNAGIASISNAPGSKGLATALSSIGSTTISAIFSGIMGTTTLSTSHVSSITITPSAPDSIAPGTTQQFSASGSLVDGETQVLTPFATWTSLNTTVADVSDTAGSKGLATANDAGTATIQADYDGIPGSATLTSSHVASISVAPANASIPKGLTQQFTADGILVDSTPQNLTTWATWASSIAGVATISNTASSKGLATSVDVGTTTITAAFDSIISSSATLTVTPAVLTSIAITPTNQSIALGRTQQYIAVGTYSDTTTQNITSLVTWHSSSTSVAGINSSGLTTSVAQGTTAITASLSGITSNSATLTVTPAELVSITITPLSPSIVIGSTQQFYAIGTYTNGSMPDITTAVSWQSSITTIATISNTSGTKGLATASWFSTGSTNITASYLAITSNTAVLTVHY